MCVFGCKVTKYRADIQIKRQKKSFFKQKVCIFEKNAYLCTRFTAKTGKSYTASSLRILQDGNVAKVVGCSGAM